MVHSEDINGAAAFVVNPETHNLYVGYGRGHLPQSERRKFMTGRFMYGTTEHGELKNLNSPKVYFDQLDLRVTVRIVARFTKYNL